jgi:hypothetical protein
MPVHGGTQELSFPCEADLEMDDLATEGERIRGARARLREEYRGLYAAVSAILFEEDPIGINFETNADEYEPEVGTILPRLGSCRSVADVQRVTQEEFVRWFGRVEAGPVERYRRIAERIWEEWEKLAPERPPAPG